MNAIGLHIKKLYSSIVKFFTEDIWNFDQTESRARRKILHYGRVVVVTVKNIGKVRLGIYAAQLCFCTTLALVPFVAVMFFITGGLGLENYLQNTLYQIFADNAEILDFIIAAAGNIISSGEKGLFGIISSLIFVWTIIWLLFSTQRAFNTIWGVKAAHGFGKNLLYYLGILLVAPFLIMLFLSFSIFFSNTVGSYGIKIWHFRTISAFVQWVVYYLLSIIAFTLINIFVPNRKIRFKAALKASIITAFFFVLIQFLYTGTQLMVSRLNTIYGVVAAFPLFLIWLDISWTIILVGAEVTHAFQTEIETIENERLKLK